MITNFARIVVKANVAHECFSQVNVTTKSQDKNKFEICRLKYNAAHVKILLNDGIQLYNQMSKNLLTQNSVAISGTLLG